MPATMAKPTVSAGDADAAASQVKPIAREAESETENKREERATCSPLFLHQLTIQHQSP